jgi:hypothetical protein
MLKWNYGEIIIGQKFLMHKFVLCLLIITLLNQALSYEIDSLMVKSSTQGRFSHLEIVSNPKV